MLGVRPQDAGWPIECFELSKEQQLANSIPNSQTLSNPLPYLANILPHFEAGETCSAATICGDSQKYQGALSSLIAICSTMHSVETIHRLLEASLRKKHAATAGAGRRHDGCIAAASESSLRVVPGVRVPEMYLCRVGCYAKMALRDCPQEARKFSYYVGPLAVGATKVIGYPVPRTARPLPLIWQRLIASHCRTDQKRFGRPRFKDPNALLRVAPIMRM